jgi:hypothetical protein
MDGDGTCDALDDDIDGDGVANDDDFAPEDPDKSEGKGGCPDASAFNYDETAEVDDASCFTLEDAESAVASAMAGIVSIEGTGYSDDMIMQTTMIMDDVNGKASISLAMLGEDGEPLYQATYVDDGNGFVEVELYVTPDEGGSPMIEQYKVNGAYYVADMDDDEGWSHCEYDGTDWYCTNIYNYQFDEMEYNSNSETETYHLFTSRATAANSNATTGQRSTSTSPTMARRIALMARTKTTSSRNSPATTETPSRVPGSTTHTMTAATAATSPSTT